MHLNRSVRSLHSVLTSKTHKIYSQVSMSSVKHLASLSSCSSPNLLCQPLIVKSQLVKSPNFNPILSLKTTSNDKNILINNKNDNNNIPTKYVVSTTGTQTKQARLVHTVAAAQHIRSAHSLVNRASNFRQMAGIQKLASEPTREHIENIRMVLRNISAKDNSDQEISLQRDESSGIALVRIKSAAKNGISAKMMCDFLDVLDELYSWEEGKGVIIYGHNNFFCSGGDLVSVRAMANYEDGLKMATLMQYNLAKLQTLPMITMALIEGKALGGGAEIATTMDLRLMVKSAKIGYVHARIRIVAAWGGGARLVQLIGPSRAIDMMSSGRLVDASEALQMGWVNHILDDTNKSSEQIMNEARKYLQQHLIGVKSTIVAIKGIINAARTLPLEQALVAEAQLLSSTWGKPAHIEALDNKVKHRGDQE